MDDNRKDSFDCERLQLRKPTGKVLYYHLSSYFMAATTEKNYAIGWKARLYSEIKKRGVGNLQGALLVFY